VDDQGLNLCRVRNCSLYHYFFQTTFHTHKPVRKTSTIVGFEVLTAVSMKIAVFWVVAPYRPDDGGSKDL
jgi:hypothetical protein